MILWLMLLAKNEREVRYENLQILDHRKTNDRC